MLANAYPDDQERGNVMGFAMSSLGLGVTLGPPFGGITYQFIGESAPFIILASLAALVGATQVSCP